MPSFKSGTLWPLVVHRTEAALRCGALQPIATLSERVEQAGVRFIIRMISSPQRKQKERSENPFLPFDEALFVSEISDTHVCLLNRFNVIEHHLLFVTRYFEDQELPLTLNDFAVILTALREVDGLAFYNSSHVSGASQPHRHLQLVPLSLVPEDRLPMSPLIRAALCLDDQQRALPFRHAVTRIPQCWLEDTSASAAAMQDSYVQLLRTAGVIDCTTLDAEEPLAPYNLLVTREWMLLVPRSRECWQRVSINALGFAGSLFVRERRQMRAIKAHGPMNVLRSVAVSA